MEDKITLDRESFKTLASETRITILKSLDRRRKTLTELSKELKMSPSTVKEHMDNLCNADLTLQMDEGHKWKYYELTRKGKNILHPEETKIWILLSISVLAMLGIFYDMMRKASFATREMAAPAASDALKGPVGELPAEALGAGTQATAQALPILHIIGLVIFAVILGSCLVFLVLNRKKMVAKM